MNALRTGSTFYASDKSKICHLILIYPNNARLMLDYNHEIYFQCQTDTQNRILLLRVV